MLPLSHPGGRAKGVPNVHVNLADLIQSMSLKFNILQFGLKES